jgi:DNA-binding NtrC family response regulator
MDLSMTYSRYISMARRAPAAGVATHARGQLCAQLAYAEFLHVASRRANVLLTGPDDRVASLLDALQGHLRPPVTRWRRGRALELPRGGDGTLLIHEPGALSCHEQHRLFEWLTVRTCRTQIVSTSTRSLWPEVQSGQFMPGLFYRLNVISLDLT